MRIRDDFDSKAKTREELTEERRKLKPEIGNVVIHMGERYVVTQVGSKYVRIYREGGDKRFTTIAPINAVIKT